MDLCVHCEKKADYHVANPGTNHQTFCKDHLPKFLNTTLPFVTEIIEVVVEEVKKPSKPRKKAVVAEPAAE